MEHVLGNNVNFSNLVIYLLSLLTSCQFTNELNREISRGVFQNHGVCGQVFPFLPSPSPFHFLCSRSNFRAITRLVTLATQATSIGEVPKTEPITLSFQEIRLLPTEPLRHSYSRTLLYGHLLNTETSFTLPQGKALTFSLNSTCLI